MSALPMNDTAQLPDTGTAERDRLPDEVMRDVPREELSEAAIDEMARIDAMRPRFVGTPHEI